MNDIKNDRQFHYIFTKSPKFVKFMKRAGTILTGIITGGIKLRKLRENMLIAWQEVLVKFGILDVCGILQAHELMSSNTINVTSQWWKYIFTNQIFKAQIQSRCIGTIVRKYSCYFLMQDFPNIRVTVTNWVGDCSITSCYTHHSERRREQL